MTSIKIILQCNEGCRWKTHLTTKSWKVEGASRSQDTHVLSSGLSCYILSVSGIQVSGVAFAYACVRAAKNVSERRLQSLRTAPFPLCTRHMWLVSSRQEWAPADCACAASSNSMKIRSRPDESSGKGQSHVSVLEWNLDSRVGPLLCHFDLAAEAGRLLQARRLI